MDTRMYVYGIHYVAIGRRLFRPKSFSNSFSGLFVTGVSFYDYFENHRVAVFTEIGSATLLRNTVNTFS